LLIVERFNQFIELVDQCEFLTGEKPVMCSDLQGFWDMVDYQVIDVKKKFDYLEKLRSNNWIETKPEIKKAVVKEVCTF
jgi:disks large-associated protein 5